MDNTINATFAVSAAVRRRERTGIGAEIRLSAQNVALALAGTLGYLTEVQISSSE